MYMFINILNTYFTVSVPSQWTCSVQSSVGGGGGNSQYEMQDDGHESQLRLKKGIPSTPGILLNLTPSNS